MLYHAFVNEPAPFSSFIRLELISERTDRAKDRQHVACLVRLYVQVAVQHDI